MGASLSCEVPVQDRLCGVVDDDGKNKTMAEGKRRWQGRHLSIIMPDSVAFPVQTAGTTATTKHVLAKEEGGNHFQMLPDEIVQYIICETVPMAYGPVLGRVCLQWRRIVVDWRRCGLTKNRGKPMDYVWVHGAISAAVQAILDGRLPVAKYIADDRQSVLLPSLSSSDTAASHITGTAAWAHEKQRTKLAAMWARCVVRAILIAPMTPEQTQTALAWVWPQDAPPGRSGWGHRLTEVHLTLAVQAANDMAFAWMHQRMAMEGVPIGDVWSSSSSSSSSLPSPKKRMPARIISKRWQRNWLQTQLSRIVVQGMVRAVGVIDYVPDLLIHETVDTFTQAALSSGSPAMLQYMHEQFQRYRTELGPRRLNVAQVMETMGTVRRVGLAIFDGRWKEATATVKHTQHIRRTLSWCYVAFLSERRRCPETGQWRAPQFRMAEKLYTLLGASMDARIGTALVGEGEKAALVWLSERGLLIGKTLAERAMRCGDFTLAKWLMTTLGVPETIFAPRSVHMTMPDRPQMRREWRTAGPDWRHASDRSLAWQAEFWREAHEMESWLQGLGGSAHDDHRDGAHALEVLEEEELMLEEFDGNLLPGGRRSRAARGVLCRRPQYMPAWGDDDDDDDDDDDAYDPYIGTDPCLED
jgi:hypothetical protein